MNYVESRENICSFSFPELRGDENKKYEDASASGQLVATAKRSKVDVL